jgi:hypothetical protein
MDIRAVSEKLLEVRDHDKEGYRPLIDHGAWRVAILNYSDALRVENLTNMQRHNETDEVFVLLRGRCILFLGEGTDAVTTVHATDMRPCKLYNVKKAVWHTHTLSRNAMVLIVENRDTTLENSPFCSLSDAQRRTIMELAERLQADSDPALPVSVEHGTKD